MLKEEAYQLKRDVVGVHPWNFFPTPQLSIINNTPSLELHHN
jgi:hypothetical protein